MSIAITSPWALYNEIDDYAAEWLENLIAAGVIAPGIVDRRSIEDLRGDDLRGFRQVHLFAGIGVWSYALRCAGVSDDTALWTGSCPCQPFSAAGQRGGMDDERHLWPAFLHLLRECRPPKVYGEQVASKDGLAWSDLVQSDMEGSGYALGFVDTCSAGFGAPHIRQRLRFAAYDLRSSSDRLADNWRSGCDKGFSGNSGPTEGSGRECWDVDDRRCGLGRMAHHHQHGSQRSPFEALLGEGRWEEGNASGRSGTPLAHGMGDTYSERAGGICGTIRSPQTGEGGWGSDHYAFTSSTFSRMANTESVIKQNKPERFESLFESGATKFIGVDDGADGRNGNGFDSARGDACRGIGHNSSGAGQRMDWTGPTNGFWRDADWLLCRDGKWRPVEPGTFPLVDGTAFRLGSSSAFEGKSRQGMLKAYGNAVDAEATREFIEAVLECEVIELDRNLPFDHLI